MCVPAAEQPLSAHTERVTGGCRSGTDMENSLWGVCSSLTLGLIPRNGKTRYAKNLQPSTLLFVFAVTNIHGLILHVVEKRYSSSYQLVAFCCNVFHSLVQVLNWKVFLSFNPNFSALQFNWFWFFAWTDACNPTSLSFIILNAFLPLFKYLPLLWNNNFTPFSHSTLCLFLTLGTLQCNFWDEVLPSELCCSVYNAVVSHPYMSLSLKFCWLFVFSVMHKSCE